VLSVKWITLLEKSKLGMKEITLTVDDASLDTVLTILNNLKSGLITSIKSDAALQRKTVHYQAKKAGVIYEHESGTNDKSGKYSAAAYKDRLKKK